MRSRQPYPVAIFRVAPCARNRIRAAGFTLFELVIVIVLVALFCGVLLDRFQVYHEMAERTAMEQTAGAVRSALTIQMAGLITKGRTEDIPKLAAANPMIFLNQSQKNYVGEYFDPKPNDIPPGSWYFDLKNKQLVYTVNRGPHFVPDRNGHKLVRYQVNLVYNDWLQKELGKQSKTEIGGIVLDEVEPYSWTIK